nr:hypothetical protein [Rhodospirillales bacterium]
MARLIRLKRNLNTGHYRRAALGGTMHIGAHRPAEAVLKRLGLLILLGAWALSWRFAAAGDLSRTVRSDIPAQPRSSAVDRSADPAGPRQADPPAVARPALAGGGMGLATIIVTATKRAENVQTVPIAIDVVEGRRLANQ